MIKVTVDFETQSALDLKKFGAFEYSMDPSTIVMCMGYKVPGVETRLLDFNLMQLHFSNHTDGVRAAWLHRIANPAFVFTAHNAFFEQCIYNNVLVKRFGWPPIAPTKWRCSMAKASSVAIPAGLGSAAMVARTKVQKDYEGHRVMMKLCKPTAAWKAWHTANESVRVAGKRVYPKTIERANRPEPIKFYSPVTEPGDFKKLYHYCRFDVEAEEQLDKVIPDLIPFEQKLWHIDQKINLSGVSVDMPLVNKIAGVMESEAKVMNRELDALTMGLVSSGNARAAILDFLTLEGIELPNLRAKTVDDFLENQFMTDDAEELLKIRRALSKSSTAKYATFQRRARTDGRVRDILGYHIASTGRWGGKGIQPQNFPRGIIKDIFEAIDRINTCSLEDLKLLYGQNLMPLFSSVLRGMFVATKGHDLFVEDFNAIECRVTWWLADHTEGLKLFREGLDPYRVMAAMIFRKSILDVTDEERQVGKAAVLGCGYQMGGKKFVSSAWDVYRAKVNLEMAKVAVTAYRELHFPVTELWDNYSSAAVAAIENRGKSYRVGRVLFYVKGRFLKIRLPSLRELSYCDPTVTWEDVQLTNDKGEVTSVFKAKKLSFMSVNHKAKKEDCLIPKWTREKTYGGKLTENIVQAVSRDILAEAIVRADDAGFRVLMHSHDEMVAEAPKGKFQGEDYKAIMEQLPDWAAGLPLKSGGWVGDRYKKG